ncbi:TNT domain-containing protein [Amycolatopsis taiwanensis]|uniref:TNT domain-containing protein n=1 Tax=Amycolatopsis taiwanensis TaxID=342230 RepID=UPI000483283E|nr:TNT domain-containing protein [Amycolatopsis taiwanensis]
MRTFRRLSMALMAWLMLMFGAGTAIAQASAIPNSPLTGTTRSETSQHPTPSPPAICPTDAIPGAFTELPSRPFQRYFRNDPRLGPADLPENGAVGELLRDYHRLDSFQANPFIDCFWDPTATMGNGGWRFPTNNGFADGFTVFNLVPGQVIDRFGSNGGRFFSPFGAPFSQRALPPSSLDTLDQAHPFGYHVFRVIAPFTVQAGTSAPWFGQPGGGLQYFSPTMNADQLIAGNLVEPLN